PVMLGLTCVYPTYAFAQNDAECTRANKQESLTTSPDAFLVKPYLQLGYDPQPKPQSLDVVWHAKREVAKWLVKYKEASEITSWKEAKILEPRPIEINVPDYPHHWVYNATMSDLEPGKPFDYCVKRNDSAVFVGHATAKNSENQPYRFVVFGDCGAGTKSQRR